MNIGAIEGGVETIFSQWVTPIGIPITAVSRIPQSSPPGIFLTTINPQMKMPISAKMTDGVLNFAKLTSVFSWATTMPQFCKPIKAMNRPIPAPIAALILAGIA